MTFYEKPGAQTHASPAPQISRRQNCTLRPTQQLTTTQRQIHTKGLYKSLQTDTSLAKQR